MRPTSPTAVSPNPRFGARVREARTNAKLSQRALAEQVGVGRRTVQLWEAGTGGITWGNIEQVAIATGVEVDWLAGQVDDVPAGVGQRPELDEIRQVVSDAVRQEITDGLAGRLERIEALLEARKVSRQDLERELEAARERGQARTEASGGAPPPHREEGR
jgi:transcriptional regulator with XRE-family HTH domain